MSSKPKAAILHGTLNVAGGGERVALAFIKILKDLGYEVHLITTEPTDWGRIYRLVGRDVVRPDKELPLLPFEVRYFGIYSRAATSLRLLLNKYRYDLTINTHGDLMPIATDIIYMHFPAFALLLEQAENQKYKESLFWRIYFEPFRLIQLAFAKLLRSGGGALILTNSEYSREAIKRHLGRDAIVLPPPVNIDEFLEAGRNPPNARDDIVVACGRFTPEKRYELILEVADRLRDADFKIIGARSGKVTGPYLEKLRSIIRERRLDNVELLMDYPRTEQLRLYSKARVFIHAMVGEHFGIAVVEGMAAGLVPVVHASGGPWNDIVYRGKYGYGFRSLDAAVEAVEEALRNHPTLYHMVRARAMRYSYREFEEKARRIVEVIAR